MIHLYIYTYIYVAVSFSHHGASWVPAPENELQGDDGAGGPENCEHRGIDRRQLHVPVHLRFRGGSEDSAHVGAIGLALEPFAW